MVRVLAGDSVPAKTRSAPSCSRRWRDFSAGGRLGLLRTEEYTDSLPVGPRGFRLGVLVEVVSMMVINSARTLFDIC